MDPTYAPFESKSPSGQLVGFEIDSATKPAGACRCIAFGSETGFDGIIPALQGRKFDAILSAMSITPKRQEQVAFSQPHAESPDR